MVDVLHIDFSATYVIGQSSLENMLYFNILNEAKLYSEILIFFITSVPVNDFIKSDFENELKPDTSVTPISLNRWAIFISTYFSTISSEKTVVFYQYYIVSTPRNAFYFIIYLSPILINLTRLQLNINVKKL